MVFIKKKLFLKGSTKIILFKEENMKKLLPFFALLLLISACVTTGGDSKTVTTAVIRGIEIHVTDERSTVQEQLGRPDKLLGSQWHYIGRTKDEPTYIIFMDDSVQRIQVIEPEKTE